ncbi:MAG: hypothetical protein U1A05_04565 [Alphaproteobacteria bacterium]|nr:hypothetical protein [Alphaproteobacteria bacterium]
MRTQHILIAIGLIGAGSFFLITKVASNLGLVPMQTESIISQLTRHVLGEGFFYTFFQFLTASILFLAANTSFAGFPQLAVMVAKDQWLPKQLSALGDRLVFSHGLFGSHLSRVSWLFSLRAIHMPLFLFMLLVCSAPLP